MVAARADTVFQPTANALWQHEFPMWRCAGRFQQRAGPFEDVLERLNLFEQALAAHRRYHACFEKQASEGAQRLARVAAHESEARALRDAAGRAQSLAAQSMHSNSELARNSERLLQASLEDVLTGLPNRRRLDMALANLSLFTGTYGVAT